jgi:uncharacterized membrane protein
VSALVETDELTPTVGVHELSARVAERGRVSVQVRRLVYATAAAYGVVCSAAATLHWKAFQEGHADLGTMAQAVWSTAHGHFLETTAAQSGADVIRFAVHVDPLLVLLTPLWWVWSSPLVLLIIQALAVSAGALPVYWLAQKHLQSDRAAAHFAFAYLLYPATQFNAFMISTGFHAVSLAVPFVLFAIWFLDEERLLLFGVFALLAASTKEEIPAAIGCLGVWYAFRNGRRFLGFAIFTLGMAVTALNFFVVIPHYSRSGVDPFVGRYAAVGSTPGGILHTLAVHPLTALHEVATGHKLLYVALLLAPFAGLWLFEPLLFLGAVPDLAINLLSSKTDQTALNFHWTAGIVPFVVASSILGAARLKRDPAMVSLAALVAVAAVAIYSPFWGTPRDIRLLTYSNSPQAAKIHALALIPPSVPVSASNQLGGYLVERRFDFFFPLTRGANWVIIDRNDPTIANQRAYHRAIGRLERNPAWLRVYGSDGVEVFRRRATSP